MECIRCGGFSSARTCWSCSQRPDAVDHALLEMQTSQIAMLQKELGEAWAAYHEARDKLEAVRPEEKGPFRLPPGWHITIDCEKKQAIVTHPEVGGYAASDNGNEAIASVVLYRLAVALAGSPFSPLDAPFAAGDRHSQEKP